MYTILGRCSPLGKTIEECQRIDNAKHDSKLIEFRTKGEQKEVYGVLSRNNRREISSKNIIDITILFMTYSAAEIMKKQRQSDKLQQ